MTSRRGDGRHSRVTVTPDPDNPEMVIIRTRKRTKRRKAIPRPLRIVLVVVAVIAVLAAVAAGVVTYLVNQGENQMRLPASASAQEITYNGHRYVFNDHVVSILILGKDDETTYDIARPEASCTDVNMLMCYDTVGNTVTVISIPRDAMVDVDLYKNDRLLQTDTRQLAVAYSVDVSTDEQRAENVVKSVSHLLYGLPVGKYFVIDEEGFKDMTHAIGGVSLEALDTYPGASFSKGDTVLLEGESAWSYVRYRDVTKAHSASARMKRQVQFVKALLDEVRHSSVNELVKLFRSVSQHANTNVGAGDVAYIASCVVSDGGPSSVDFISLVGDTKVEKDVDGESREHVYLNETSVRKAALAAYYTRID